MWYGNAAGPQLMVTFRQYERTEDDSNVVAVLCLTNSSDRKFAYISANQISSNGVEIARCQFREQTGAGWTNWMEQKSQSPVVTTFTLMPQSSTLVAAPVPKDGRVANVGIFCIELPEKWPWVFERLKPFVSRLLPPRRNGVCVWCETAVSSKVILQESGTVEFSTPKATANK